MTTNNTERSAIELLQAAASLAARFHDGQWRKDRRTPYVAHPFRVSMIVRELFGVHDAVTVAAAILHDVIEDTPADYDDVCDACGAEVAGIVAALTKDMRIPEVERERVYDQQLAAASWQAKLIKLADVYDNLCDAEPGRMRRRARKKVPRAIEVAGEEPQLAGAVRVLQELLDRTPPE